MKPTILITKIGAVAYTDEYNKTRTANRASAGEQGTTAAIVNHLLSRDDLNVVYFGQWRGEVPEGLTYIESDIKHLNDLTTSREQKERWKNDLANIVSLDPKMFITIAGYAAGFSHVDNPNWISVQSAAVRYTGPTLNIIQTCELPRIVVVNDIRNYPKEGEMSCGWNWIRPCALLSQREKNWTRIVNGMKWNIREVYSAAEHWRDFIRLPYQEKTLPVSVIGHAHMLDGKKLKGYDTVWRLILHDLSELKRKGMKIYGKGWEHFSEYDSECMGNLVTPAEVSEILAKSKMCPCAITGGELYTNKGRFCLAQNCLPLFYGNGGPYTYDPLGKQLSLDSVYRIVLVGDLLRLVDYFDNNEISRQQLINKLWSATTPDYSRLDECIDDILKGCDTESDEWWEKYGGYRR